MSASRLILGSRSPRRRELLELLVSPESIEVRPPLSSDELGFDGLTSWLEIAQRLQQIAREKNDDVLAQLSPRSACEGIGERGGVSPMSLALESSRHIPCAVSLGNADGTWNVPATLLAKRVPLGVSPPVGTISDKNRGADAAPLACTILGSPTRRDDTELVLTADTVIVASDADARFQVLGQPPADESWRDVVRRWFCDLYAGRSHIAATAVCLTDRSTGRRLERIVQSHVWVREDVEPLLDWYLATDEPRGKAGGYALQGLASVFVTRVEGSITNVVGLPLEALVEMLPQLGWPLR